MRTWRAAPRGAINQNVAFCLLGETMGHAQAEAGPLAIFLSCVKWLKGALQNLRRHAGTRVADGDPHEVVDAGVVAVGYWPDCIFDSEGQTTAPGHRITRVDGQIDQHGFQLRPINHDAPAVFIVGDLHADARSKRLYEQIGDGLDNFVTQTNDVFTARRRANATRRLVRSAHVCAPSRAERRR